MAYMVICRLGDRDSEGYRVQVTLPSGKTFERRLPDADLTQLNLLITIRSPQTELLAEVLYKLLFEGAEALLDEAFARAKSEADGVVRVHLQIAARELDRWPWELAKLTKTGPLEIVRSFPALPQLAGKLPILPFRVLAANLGEPHEDARTFPLRTVLLNIFRDPERLTKVFHPTTMAGVDRDELAGVLSQSRYEILHLQVLTQRLDNEAPCIVAPGEGPPLVARTLLPLLLRARARLLILQLRRPPYTEVEAAQLVEFGRDIVEGGGPAVLVVPFDGPDSAGGTFMLNRFYDRIVHDEPLDAAFHWAKAGAASRPTADAPFGTEPVLLLGQGGENLLRISPLAADLLERADRNRTQVAYLSRRFEQLDLDSALDLSHPRNTLANAAGMFNRAEQIAREIKDWHSESRGLIPLHEATQAADEGQRVLSDLQSEIVRMEESSARVVNFCFLRDKEVVAGDHGAREGDKEAVPGDQGLLRDTPYQVRLQIGKPWKLHNIVRNAHQLPEHYLEKHSDETGIDLDVCLYTEDFSLPDGDIFPLRLPKAPAASSNLDIAVTPKKLGVARLRVCVYYRQNLVQSLMAVARVTARKTKPRQEANYADVEFSMADTLLGVETLPPRTLNILTNDNGDGTFKIAIRGTDIKLDYTLTSSTVIGDIRKTLLLICATLNPDGTTDKYNYSDEDNTGSEQKLVDDLKKLASIGKRLYTAIIIDPANLEKDDTFEQNLKRPGEIQIAITSSAKKIYPWALVYDRGLESGADIAVCPVMLKKLAGAGQPANLYSGSCIDGGCPHASDIKMVCPLGFWGFRHAIEQLPPNNGVVKDAIVAPRQPSFIMAVNQELAGKAHRIEVERDSGLTADYYDVKADFSTALKSKKPHIVYFYCHGGRRGNIIWLGVGKKDEYVEPDDFRTWKTRWPDTTPIVIVNGCHTVDLSPDDLLSFLNVFAWCRAAGVIGTEINIVESLAREFGRFFLTRFVKGEKVAAIIRDFRLTLLAKRNVLGLSYTPYCHGDLHLASS